MLDLIFNVSNFDISLVIGFSRTIWRVDEDEEVKDLTPGMPRTTKADAGATTRHAADAMATMERFFIVLVLKERYVGLGRIS